MKVMLKHKNKLGIIMYIINIVFLKIYHNMKKTLFKLNQLENERGAINTHDDEVKNIIDTQVTRRYFDLWPNRKRNYSSM